MRIGIITGLLEEADSFRPGQGHAHRDMPFYCREGEHWTVACAGVGKVNAALAATCLISHGADCLLSLGVAGRIGPRRDPLFWIADAFQHDFGAWRQDEFVAYRAGTLPIGISRLEPMLAMADPGLGLPTATILTGDSFIEDEVRAEALAGQFEADLVDMETGSVAQIAGHHDLPWAGIRAVSDAADGAGVADFQTNLNRAAVRAAQAADRFVDLVAAR
ncbi:5'-methylthioadenosine/S-adenosylhomocysteine nucleosidase family protein [Sphingomicrobium arenosum]|uniref:5'-methylthioadenosine/S-adenosylhomocysteine nucleosidase family protein n=1 Tax=Sphingomicrobium arenosum TaxID=2233861 RepID=UPI002240EF36|nr:5'-methylthioadenosine/S-adenosylhomocysteine nucleosidase [Sphingomicrobium arenosum]